MARNRRLAAFCAIGIVACVVLIVGAAYYAARQVRPFYRQALYIQPEVRERGSRELESRATALYSDARQAGKWQAVFTAEQINAWLAVQLAPDPDDLDLKADHDLAEPEEHEFRRRIRDPRVAISPDLLKVGFRTTSGGIDTVISIDAGVFLTEEGGVALQLSAVRAGALPLPVMQLADEIAAACEDLKLPVRWTRQDDLPVAILELDSDDSNNREFFIDSIKLGEGELQIAGHTQLVPGLKATSILRQNQSKICREELPLEEFELRLTPSDARSALQVARRTKPNQSASSKLPASR